MKFLAISTGYSIKYLPFVAQVENLEQVLIDERLAPVASRACGIDKNKLHLLPARASEEIIQNIMEEQGIEASSLLELKPSEKLFDMISKSSMPTLTNGDLDSSAPLVTLEQHFYRPYLDALRSELPANMLPVVVCYRKPKSDAVSVEKSEIEGKRQSLALSNLAGMLARFSKLTKESGYLPVLMNFQYGNREEVRQQTAELVLKAEMQSYFFNLDYNADFLAQIAALHAVSKVSKCCVSVGNASTYLHEILFGGPYTANVAILPETAASMSDHQSWQLTSTVQSVFNFEQAYEKLCEVLK